MAAPETRTSAKSADQQRVDMTLQLLKVVRLAGPMINVLRDAQRPSAVLWHQHHAVYSRPLLASWNVTSVLLRNTSHRRFNTLGSYRTYQCPDTFKPSFRGSKPANDAGHLR